MRPKGSATMPKEHARMRLPMTEERKQKIIDMVEDGHGFTRIMRECRMGDERLRQFLHDNDLEIQPNKFANVRTEQGMPQPITTRRKGLDDPLLHRLHLFHPDRASY